MVGKGEPLGIVQDVQIWPYEPMLYTKPGIHSRKWDTKISFGFGDSNWSPNLNQRSRLSDTQQANRKRENLANSGLYRSDWPQGKTEVKRKERLVPRPCQRTDKIWWWRWYQLRSVKSPKDWK